MKNRPAKRQDHACFSVKYRSSLAALEELSPNAQLNRWEDGDELIQTAPLLPKQLFMVEGRHTSRARHGPHNWIRLDRAVGGAQRAGDVLVRLAAPLQCEDFDQASRDLRASCAS
jgi:hypothetical protein